MAEDIEVGFKVVFDNVRSLNPIPQHACAFCGTRVYPRSAFQRVSGYVKKRKGGGANMIHAKVEMPGEYACEECIAILKRGGNPRSGNDERRGA